MVPYTLLGTKNYLLLFSVLNSIVIELLGAVGNILSTSMEMYDFLLAIMRTCDAFRVDVFRVFVLFISCHRRICNGLIYFFII